MTQRGIEIKTFHAIWWTLAVLLPDLLGLALRDWRGAVAGALISVVMIVLSVRTAASVPHDVGETDPPTMICSTS